MKRLLIASALTLAFACTGGCNPTYWWKYRSNLANNGLGTTSTLQGVPKWKFATGGPVFCTPAIDAANLYFGSDDTNFYAVSKAGAKVWSFATGGHAESSAALANGVLYFGSSDKNVYAVAAANGAKAWSFATNGEVIASPTYGGVSVPDPSSHGFVTVNVVIVGSMDNRVYAIDADTGKTRWVFQTGGPVQSSPAWSPSGNLYIGSNDRNVYALDPSNGSKLWSFTTNGEVHASPAVGSDGTVYVPSQDGSLYALDGATGQKKWAFTPGAPRSEFASAAVLFTSNVDTIFSGNGNGFFAVDANGNQLWRNTGWAGPGFLTAPAIARDGTIYAGSFVSVAGTAAFVAADATTGNVRWTFVNLGGEFVGSPSIDSDGTVYAGSADGNLYAFK